MILHVDGSWERASWHTAETYPDSYFINEKTESGKVLADKIVATRYFNLVVENGELIDIEAREPTAEEIEVSKPAKSPELLRIEHLEQLVADLASLQLGV